MNMNKNGFMNIALVVVIVAIIAVGGYFMFFRNSPTVTEAPSTNTTPTASQKTNPVATGRGGGGVDIPTINDFKITSPISGQTWSKGDSSKTINWIYPAELKGRKIHLGVYLVNLDLIEKGRDSGDPDVSLDIYTAFTSVPNSGKGELSWDLLRVIPETAFYGYSGNSRIVVAISDSDNLKNYQSASDIFVVSPSTTTSAPIVPIKIISPDTNAQFHIGEMLNITWTGSTHASDMCEISLVGPLDQNGEVIQSLGAIIPIGGSSCSSGAFSWKINNSYIHGGYNYNVIIRTPYSSYSRTINIAQ